MAEYKIEKFFSNNGSRNDVRMRVVQKLSEEIAGTGKGDKTSRYTYIVENLSDGKKIYLRRPANLHWGFDFIVCVKGVNFNSNSGRRRNYPSHLDIIKDLKAKASQNSSAYKSLFALIEQVYNCVDIDFKEANNLGYSNGFSCEMILAVLKWLFIEQDIRYWNYSGRDMLWDSIKSIPR
jgi:hypothetical protein